MQGNDIAAAQQLIKRQSGQSFDRICCAVERGVIDGAMAASSKAHLHPQSLTQSRHVATQHATANQAEFFACQIMDPGAKIAKMRTLLPGSGA